jgi:hypothetical protein
MMDAPTFEGGACTAVLTTSPRMNTMTDTITKHFVTFLSPGSFVAENTTKAIDSWDVPAAQAMAETINERHNAVPYAFFFTTRTRGPDDLDSEVTAASPTYYIHCKIETLEEIEARNDPAERILRDNMRCNGYTKVVVTTRGWRWTQYLRDGDVVLREES